MKKGLVIISLFLAIVVTLGLLTPINNQINSMSYEGYNIPEREIEMEYNVPPTSGDAYHYNLYDTLYTVGDVVSLHLKEGSYIGIITNNSTGFIDLYPETLDIENYPNEYKLNIDVNSYFEYADRGSSYTVLEYVITFVDSEYKYLSEVKYEYLGSQVPTAGTVDFTYNITIPANAKYFVVDEEFNGNSTTGIPNKTVENLNVPNLTIIGEYQEDGFLIRNPLINSLISIMPILAVVSLVFVAYIVIRNED